jgi:hypothetical protein
VVDERLLIAAEELGAVYWMLRLQEKLPLQRSDIPTEAKVSSKIRLALEELRKKYIAAEYIDTYREYGYLKAYQLVKPKLEASAAIAGIGALERQAKALADLERRLSRNGVSERLHSVAKNVISGRMKASASTGNPFGPGQIWPRQEDYDYAEKEFRRTGRKLPEVHIEDEYVTEDVDPEFERLKHESLRNGIRAGLRAELSIPSSESPESRRETKDLWRVLSFHPKLENIVAEYAESAEAGDRYARELVTDARVATAEFDATLRKSPERVWAYAPLIALGVKRLGLDGDSDFSAYAVDLGQVLSATWINDALTALGLIILLVGILLSGPLAVAGVALESSVTGLALADLATTGASAQLTYLHEREADMAAKGGGFSATGHLFKEVDYSESKLAGAATLMCGIAFVFSGAKLLKTWRGRTAGTMPPPLGPMRSGKAARLASEAEEATATAGKALRRGTGTRARFAEREWRAPVPRRSVPRPDRADEARAAAASGMRGLPPEEVTLGTEVKASGSRSTISELPPSTGVAPESTGTASKATASRATLVQDPAGGVVRPPGAAKISPKSPPDTSFSLTPEQRAFPSKALTFETEKAVGKKLERWSGLTADESAEGSKFLRRRIRPDGKAPPITKPMLLKEPVITDPRKAAPRTKLASAKPDYLYLAPNQVEVFEVTVDTRFSIVPQEEGMRFSGSAVKAGDPHKQIQIRKTLDYLIRRYPDSRIVYNIQTVGQVPGEVRKILELELEIARKALVEEKGAGSVEIVVRAAETFSIP